MKRSSAAAPMMKLSAAAPMMKSSASGLKGMLNKTKMMPMMKLSKAPSKETLSLGNSHAK